MSRSSYLEQLYIKNLHYFQKFYPQLYKKLTNFSQSTDNSLTIEDNLYFDVLNESTNRFIYGSNSEILSDQYVHNLLSQNDNRDSKKVLFNGTLLGIHIERYFQQIDSDICMIIEPDLEMFHFSTFVVDFENLTKNRIAIFSVADSDEELEKSLLKFYYTLPYHNRNITVASINNESKSSAKKINKIFEDNTNIKNIFIEMISAKHVVDLNIESTYTKAFDLQNKGQMDQAKGLYFQILQHERYIKLYQNYEDLLIYVYKAYLELGNIFINQLEHKQAYYLYAKVIYSDDVPYEIYEAALSNYGGIHGLLNINYQYILKKLEKFYENNPQSIYIKNVLIYIYTRVNRYKKANSMLEDYDIPILPIFIDSKEQIDIVRKEFEQKLDQLLLENRKLTEDQVKSTNFFYFANHNRNNRDILIKLSTLYTKRTPSLSYIAKHCKNYRYSGKKIKIGFISNFFQKNHPIGKFINNTVKKLDKDRNFEVIVYSQSKSELQNEVNKYITLQGTLKEQRKIVAKNRLDIIIYPEIGMHTVTYFLAHARLAPIQCVLPGHPSTTGIKNIDYFLSYKHLETINSQKNYSEKLIKLNNILSHYSKPKVIENFLSKDELKLYKDSNNYLIPTSLQKLHSSFDDILLEITKKDPKAKLIFFESNSKDSLDQLIKERLLKKIDKRYISFRKWAKPDEFFSLLHHSDAVLEPTVFGFGTTMMEALSIATPIVTLPGKYIQSRGGVAFYRLIDVLDLVASDENSYINLAIKLANNREFKNSIKEKIAKNNHLIYEENGIVKELETFFKKALTNI